MDAQAQAAALADEIATHKRAIRHHRRTLAERASQLQELREQCARRGIRLVVKGEGENPWPTSSPSTRS